MPGAEQAEQEVEDDEDVIFLKPDPVEEKVTTKIEEHGVEAGLSKSGEEEGHEAEEHETVNEMEAKLSTMKSTRPIVEAVMKGEDAPQTVDSNESEQHEVEDVEASRQRLRAIHAGQLRNEALRSGVENIDEFAEMTKKMGEVQGLKSQPGATKPEPEQREAEDVKRVNTVRAEEHGVETEAEEKSRTVAHDEDDYKSYIIPGEDISEILEARSSGADSVQIKSEDDKGKEEEGKPSQRVSVSQIEKLEAMRKNISEFQKRVDFPEFADFKEFATNALREMGHDGFDTYFNNIENALVNGKAQDSKKHYESAMTLLNNAIGTEDKVNKGSLIKLFGEELKTIPQKIANLSSTSNNTQSNVTQSFVSIISRADNIVTAGARVQDQIANLRRDINVIKIQPEFKQYQEEHRAEIIQAKLDALATTGFADGINKSKVDEEVKQKYPNKLDPDQKSAYQAISKLDKLLERVEKSKVGIVKSILKGQVRKHLETMNMSPLKESIQKVGGLKTEKTEKAEVTPQSTRK